MGKYEIRETSDVGCNKLRLGVFEKRVEGGFVELMPWDLESGKKRVSDQEKHIILTNGFELRLGQVRRTFEAECSVKGESFSFSQYLTGVEELNDIQTYLTGIGESNREIERELRFKYTLETLGNIAIEKGITAALPFYGYLDSNVVRVPEIHNGIEMQLLSLAKKFIRNTVDSLVEPSENLDNKHKYRKNYGILDLSLNQLVELKHLWNQYNVKEKLPVPFLIPIMAGIEKSGISAYHAEILNHGDHQGKVNSLNSKLEKNRDLLKSFYNFND